MPPAVNEKQLRPAPMGSWSRKRPSNGPLRRGLALLLLVSGCLCLLPQSRGEESPRMQRLKAMMARRRPRAQARHRDMDPAAAEYGSAYSIDDVLQQEREEVLEKRQQTDPQKCATAAEEFVKREMAALQARRQALAAAREAGDRGGKDDDGGDDPRSSAMRRIPVRGPQHMRELRRMLFFLHVPRTGGRTYHQCFIKALFPVEQRCPRSYDGLRFDPRQPACRLLATHDDFSLMARLPGANVSLMTNVRHPVDRIISSYEFAMETAARSLRWVFKRRLDETLLQARRRVRNNLGRGPRTETRNVWPWSLLLPMLEDDLWRRRNMTGPVDVPPGSEALNAYEKAHLMMPLSEFVSHPSAGDLLHNGGTFHIVGITQNSAHKEAPFLRACTFKHPDTTAEPLLRLAKAILDDMLHIGLTEAHKESAMLLAAAVGKSMSSRAHVGPDLRLLAMSQQRVGRNVDHSEPLNVTANLERLRALHSRTRITLLAHYDKCVSNQRRKYVARRKAGLRLLGPGVNFSHEARGSISPATVSRIRQLNQLDIQLLQYARGKFDEQRTMFAERVKAMERDEAQGRLEGAKRRERFAGAGVPIVQQARRRRLQEHDLVVGEQGQALQTPDYVDVDGAFLGGGAPQRRLHGLAAGQTSRSLAVPGLSEKPSTTARRRTEGRRKSLFDRRGKSKAAGGGAQSSGGDQGAEGSTEMWGNALQTARLRTDEHGKLCQNEESTALVAL